MTTRTRWKELSVLTVILGFLGFSHLGAYYWGWCEGAANTKEESWNKSPGAERGTPLWEALPPTPVNPVNE